MKTLDRYIAKNFMVGYAIAFSVLLGLRIIIDLFVNLDEFTEHADLSAFEVAKSILSFYALNSTLYFRDFAGMITVLAAVFSIGKMVRNNEFVAMMATGVSLKRVIAPVVFLAVLFSGLLVIDQELIIPPLGDKLARSQDQMHGPQSYPVRFVTDGNGSLIFSPSFDVKTSTLLYPAILLRRPISDTGLWEPTGTILAEKASYNPQSRKWELTGGVFIKKDSFESPEPVVSYSSDLGPKDILIRRKSEYKTLLSWAQLAALQRQGSAVKDRIQLYSQKHFRVTDPIMSLVMLLVALPVLLCRDRRYMKSAVMISFALTGSCMITVFISKLLATEAVLGKVELWAWLPIFIFLPIALFELDSIKT